MPKDKAGNFHMNAQRAMAADKSAAPPPAAAPLDTAGPSPMDDPEAMQCIETLAAKGFTGDQVSEAMEQVSGGDDMAGMDMMHVGPEDTGDQGY